jgi:dihydroorotase
MVHIASGPPSLEEIMPILRPGDIITHCCTGRDNRLVTPAGTMREMVRLSREQGLIFDVGHGAGSFSFESAEQMLGDGFIPDVISTDIHQLAINGPCFDMPTTLSKFMALGMSLYSVIERATVRPAQVMGLADEVGTLKPGALADVAIFKLLDGDYTLYDIAMLPRKAKQLLVNTQTIINGRPMQRTCDEPMMPWIELDEAQRTLISRGHTPHAMCAC